MKNGEGLWDDVVNKELMGGVTKKLFTYKNKTYKIIREDFTLKCPDSRKWLPAVLYEQLESGLVFSREKVEFYKLFKLL